MKNRNFKNLIISCILLFLHPNINAIDVQFNRATLPVLIGETFNPVGNIMIVKSDSHKEYINGISYSLQGSTDLQDIRQIALFLSDKKGKPYSNKLLAVTKVQSINGYFKVNIPLIKDTSYFAFTIQLKEQLPLNHRINFNCTEIDFDSAKYTNSSPFKTGLRVGIALRKSCQDGVNTSRIPGLTTSTKGTLLAIYDARWDSSRDLQGDIDIALNRSTNRGETWQPMQRILDQHQWGKLPEKFNGISDACILCDEKTGHLFVAGLWMHGVLDKNTGKWIEGLTKESSQWNHQWGTKGSQPGLGVKQTSQFLITKSTDDGLTWSKPINITSIKKPEWWLFAPAPGHGITLKDGILVFPSQGRDSKGLSFSNITYSKDGGKTWKTSEPAYHNTTECMAVQLENGDIMLNMRDNRNRGKKYPNGRRICVTSNLGKTWTEHPTSYSILTEPTCMASIHKHIYMEKGKEKTVLAFFNPNSYTARNKLTLKLSFDNGLTWPKSYWLMLDEWGGAGYSCITSIDPDTLGIVYEGSGAQLVFQQINLSELLQERKGKISN